MCHSIERRAARSGPVSYVNRSYVERYGNADWFLQALVYFLGVGLSSTVNGCVGSEWVWEDWDTPVITTNVTTTTMIGLKPATRYQFRLAALSENVVFSAQWLDRDMYGRRTLVPGAVLGNWTVTEVVTTLNYGMKPCACLSRSSFMFFHCTAVAQTSDSFVLMQTLL